MPANVSVAYRYDGSFEGFLCCVFESYDRREIPSAIFSKEPDQLSLLPVKTIVTDREKAYRVLSSIPEKISPHAASVVQICFLSCHPQKELLLLKFLRLGYKVGHALTRRLADPLVSEVMKMELFVQNEMHFFKEFLRFSDYGGVLTSVIHPKNFVLPLIREHYCTRFPNEAIFIYDATHKAAFFYRDHRCEFFSVESFEPPEPGEEEKFYRALWKEYYDAIAIEGRYNPKCRMTRMPKRYWGDMTEFREVGRRGIGDGEMR